MKNQEEKLKTRGKTRRWSLDYKKIYSQKDTLNRRIGLSDNNQEDKFREKYNDLMRKVIKLFKDYGILGEHSEIDGKYVIVELK
jgi:hypothetical protein